MMVIIKNKNTEDQYYEIPDNAFTLMNELMSFLEEKT